MGGKPSKVSVITPNSSDGSATPISTPSPRMRSISPTFPTSPTSPVSSISLIKASTTTTGNTTPRQRQHHHGIAFTTHLHRRIASAQRTRTTLLATNTLLRQQLQQLLSDREYSAFTEYAALQEARLMREENSDAVGSPRAKAREAERVEREMEARRKRREVAREMLDWQREGLGKGSVEGRLGSAGEHAVQAVEGWERMSLDEVGEHVDRRIRQRHKEFERLHAKMNSVNGSDQGRRS